MEIVFKIGLFALCFGFENFDGINSIEVGHSVLHELEMQLKKVNPFVKCGEIY